MGGGAPVVGQMAIALPPQLLRRSDAWLSRRADNAAVRAEFDEARRHGLRTRHAVKLRRLRDEAAARVASSAEGGATGRQPPVAVTTERQPAVAVRTAR